MPQLDFIIFRYEILTFLLALTLISLIFFLEMGLKKICSQIFSVKINTFFFYEDSSKNTIDYTNRDFSNIKINDNI